ncbi:transglutaminase-like cysteine peptidase [Marinomonas phaeophyticola]|uniref:transglutaminase-like cysteine peptidase n=1 Tax=Marinomonas phaeophyticola TaxID=3004091 RepID=UPI002E80D920|nr:transglutaminase-like cysteine peptidase [Marinomonas sp. 15G1-11]
MNDFFNQMDFVDDIIHWGKEDYWATPIEFLGTRGGDCEDFTIAKYFSLRELGVPDEKLRLVYVKALTLDQHHMVLAYYHKPTAIPVLLDNLDKTLKPANKRRDLLPIYSFNAKNLWLSKEKGRGVLVGGSSRLSLWTDLNSRLTTFN